MNREHNRHPVEYVDMVHGSPSVLLASRLTRKPWQWDLPTDSLDAPWMLGDEAGWDAWILPDCWFCDSSSMLLFFDRTGKANLSWATISLHLSHAENVSQKTAESVTCFHLYSKSMNGSIPFRHVKLYSWVKKGSLETWDLLSHSILRLGLSSED